MNGPAHCFMKRSSLLCLTLALSASASGQVAAAPGNPSSSSANPPTQYRITGVLVSGADGSPIAHGHLEATLTGSGRMAGQRLQAGENGADTDDQGHFILPLPAAGMWDLTAEARGFVRQGYQQHQEFTTGVVLTNTAPTMDVRFALQPNGEITGIVTDEAGEAVRNAQVSLMRVLASTPGRTEPPTVRASFATTDDRGMYEFDDLAPGNYKVCVQAQPWYAVDARQRRNTDRDPPLDPSLDVAYPITWFPGGDDPDGAATLTLKGGDVQEADVRLTPVPSAHLLVSLPLSTVPGVPRGVPFMPSVQRVNSNSGPVGYIQAAMIRNAQGQVEVSGLAPGLYEVQMGGPNNGNKRSVVRVTADGAQTVSFDDDPAEAQVSFHIEGLPESEAASLQVALVDPETRQVVATSNTRSGFRARTARLRGAAARTGVNARDAGNQLLALNVPAGRYDVAIQGGPDLYLTGIDAKGAKALGRSVTLPVGASSLTLHVAKGSASLTGFAKLNDKPSVGAVMMLVPATLGETGALQIVRRDQSNSDGSFNIAQIVPGQYILIAVEDGWNINWQDAATLQRYLTGGVALDLAAGSDVTQNIAAQQP